MIEIYTDGSTLGNGKKDATGGFGVVVIEDGKIILKEQLPKIPETYEESCEILGIPPINLYTGLSTGIALSYHLFHRIMIILHHHRLGIE